MNALEQLWTWLMGHVFAAVAPLLHALGVSGYLEEALGWIEFALLGLIQIAAIAGVCAVLQRLRPLEVITDRAAVRTDMLYTFLTRLGVLPLLFFFLFSSVDVELTNFVRDLGITPMTLEQVIPGLQDQRWAVLVLYLLVLDFSIYWQHRLQHGLNWWWALHSLHHDQRTMTMWSDDRNHILDQIFTAIWEAGVALLVGVAPAEFPLVLFFVRLVEAGSHANVRLNFGWLGERLLVSPRYHRAHHAIYYAPGQPWRGCNYAILFPIWDILFGTADLRRTSYLPTGVEGREQTARIGDGLWAQQWLGFKRFGRALVGRVVD